MSVHISEIYIGDYYDFSGSPQDGEWPKNIGVNDDDWRLTDFLRSQDNGSALIDSHILYLLAKGIDEVRERVGLPPMGSD